MKSPIELFREALAAFTVQPGPSGETVVEWCRGAIFTENQEEAEELRDVAIAHFWIEARKQQRKEQAEREAESRAQVQSVLELPDMRRNKESQDKAARTRACKEESHGKQKDQRASA